MARRVVDRAAINVGGEDRNEARSIVDRLLRQYFATLRARELPTSEERQSPELPSDARSNRSGRSANTRS